MTSVEKTKPLGSDIPADPGLRAVVFYFIVLLVFVSDQYSKMWVKTRLRYEESTNIFGNAFGLTLTHNTGGAWGLLPNQNIVFVGFAAVAAISLVVAYHKLAKPDAMIGAAFALALGGAFGNLIDRLRFGYVVDFFDARIIKWPVFNIADSAISISILLLLWHFIRSGRNANLAGDSAQPED